MKLYEHSKKTILKITKLVYDEVGTNNFDTDGLNRMLKPLGIDVDTVLEANFIWTIIQINSEKLSSNNFTIENMDVPELKKFEFTFVEHVSQNIDYSYHYEDVELFSSNNRHLRDIVQTDEYDDSQPYWDSSSDDSDYGDSDTYDTTIKNVRSS